MRSAPARAARAAYVHRAALALVAGGAVLGVGLAHPLVAWAGLALTGYGLAADARRGERVAALFLGAVLASYLRLHFLWNGFCVFLPPREAHRWAHFVALFTAATDRAPAAAVLLLWRRAPRYAPLWAPPAWFAGEAAFAWCTALPLDRWLLTQASSSVARNLLAWCGYAPANLALLAFGLGIGAAFTLRPARRNAALAGALLLALAARAVPPKRQGAEALRGVVALRLDRHVARLAPIAGARLVVWPETSVRYPLEVPREGSVDGVRLPALMPGSPEAVHLVGAVNRPDDRSENSAAIVEGDGTLRWLRSKRVLFPVSETPWLGRMRAGARPMSPGSIAPVAPLAAGRVGVLVCLELFDRALVAEATPPGVELLLVTAGDSVVGLTDYGRELMVAVAQLTAAERGVAIARASWRGVAVLVAPDGEVVSRSDRGHLHNVAGPGVALDARPPGT